MLIAHMGITLRSGEFSLRDFPPGRQLAMIHGGAGAVDRLSRLREPARQAFARIEADLEKARGQSIRPSAFIQSLELTEAERYCLSALRLLEEEPSLNSGRGAALQEDGVPRVSASFMESTRGKFSAVMNVGGIVCPSELAYKLQFERYNVLDHRGASALADQLHIPRENLITEARREAWLARQKGRSSTVGCVTVDHEGKLAAGTSTGGLGGEVVGRVGDSPTIAGNYASRRAAISCTGVGEQILAMGFASRIAIRVDDGMRLKAAMEKSFQEVLERGFDFGAIAVAYHPENQSVEWVAGTTTAGFLWSVETPNGWERTSQ